MKIESLYKDIIETKTGAKIPVYKSGKTLESKYNPEREAENLLNTINQNISFFLIFGIGSGIFINKLHQKFPEAQILCVENTNEDLEFIFSFDSIKHLKNNTNIILSNIDDLEQNLIKNYIPALHGNMKIIEQVAWKNENINIHSNIINIINNAINKISADFSVQAHFGKIWQHNILTNLTYLQKNPISIKITTNKRTAAVIAAGPTLDKKIDYLNKNRDNLYIISTDTAFSTLLKYNITPELVVSLDGQFVSNQHFLHNKNQYKNTIFAFDLCSNVSSAKRIKENLIYFSSGHPLSNYAAKYLSLPTLYSGSGTVTISALDFANLLGFKNIQIIAADFSFRDGKSYAKGTYLDTIYRQNENKLISSETSFSKLLFRTELIKNEENNLTTSILESYRNSFEEYLTDNNFSFIKKDDIYELEKTDISVKKDLTYNTSFNLSDLFNNLISEYKKNNISFLLPYISYLRTKNPESTFTNLLQLAYSDFVSYNI